MSRVGFIAMSLMVVALSGCTTLTTGSRDIELSSLKLQNAVPLKSAGQVAQLTAGTQANTPSEQTTSTSTECASESSTWGLALSGGGTRSAAFAMGVLSKLHSNQATDQTRNHPCVPHLSKFKAISSVSGGGYAAYWYYMRHLYGAFERGQDPFADCFPAWLGNGDPSLKRLASHVRTNACKHSRHYSNNEADDYRWQYFLSQRMDVLDNQAERFTGAKQSNFTKSLFENAPAMLLEATTRRLGDSMREQNQRRSPYVDMYASGIETAFGVEPKKRPRAEARWSFQHYSPPQSDEVVTDDTAPVRTAVPRLADEQNNQLSSLAKATHLPQWILSMAADSNPANLKVDRLFEVTASSYGSEAHGIVAGEFPVRRLSEAVALSGAVFDKQAPPIGIPMQSGLLGMAAALNLTWGRTVEFPGGRRLHLSDGGHIENLGVYPLLRRGLRNIVVADGSYDRDGRLQDLCRLRSYLELEGLTLRFPTIASLDRVCMSSLAGEELGPTTPRYDVYHWRSAFHVGYVVNRDSSETVNARWIARLYYLKLAWDQDEVQAFLNRASSDEARSVECYVDGREMCTLAMYLAHNGDQCENENGKRLLFPHFNTFRITADASTPIYWALRQIGANAATGLLSHPISNTQSLRVGRLPPTTRKEECKWLSYGGFFPVANPKYVNR